MKTQILDVVPLIGCITVAVLPLIILSIENGFIFRFVSYVPIMMMQ